MLLELGLIAALGFLGSFGHCVGMCGPIAVAFSLASPNDTPPTNPKETPRKAGHHSLWFHLLLNLGRLLSYVLVGAAIGALGSVLVAGGQMAGVGSLLRRGIALLTGTLLIAMGLRQVAPSLLPKLPFLHPIQGFLHDRLQQVMSHTAQSRQWWTPLLLGLAWGLIPCGFLYTAQIKAAEASSALGGAVTMLAFGTGTLPMMVGLGAYSGWLSRDRSSQLFQLGGWITVLIGVLTLMRTGDLMVDYAGHGALGLLALALIARPISKLWSGPLRFRRLIGVGAFMLAIAHTLHMLEHSWNWNPAAIRFMLPQHQLGIWLGIVALLLLIPLTLTSTPAAQRQLGKYWRSLHRLSIPILLLGWLHGTLVGPTYLGNLQFQGRPLIHTMLLSCGMLVVLAVRSPLIWKLMGLQRWYTPATAKPIAPADQCSHHC